MTQAPSLIELFVAPLNRADIEYMVTGGLAAVVYGHPRLTLDVDLVVKLKSRDTTALATLWPPDDFYSPPIEFIEECVRTARGHFNVIHNESTMRADVYVAGNEPLITWALQRRIVREVEGEEVRFAPIEYVIVSKLLYFQMGRSDRHLRDVARMMQISGSDVDRAALEGWIEQSDLATEWARALAYEEDA